jgi:hypothetical protein
MEEIEAAIGHDKPFAGVLPLAPPLFEGVARNDFRTKIQSRDFRDDSAKHKSREMGDRTESKGSSNSRAQSQGLLFFGLHFSSKSGTVGLCRISSFDLAGSPRRSMPLRKARIAIGGGS